MRPGIAMENAYFRSDELARKYKNETHSLTLAESFVFQVAQNIYPARSIKNSYEFSKVITIPANHLIRNFSGLDIFDIVSIEKVYQVRVDGTDYAFFLHEDKDKQLEQISPVRALKLSLVQFLQDGR